MTEQIKWSAAPDRTSWGASMRVADIVLDRDHTLTLFCEASQTAKVDAMFAEAEREAIIAIIHEHDCDDGVLATDDILAVIRARGEK